MIAILDALGTRDAREVRVTWSAVTGGAIAFADGRRVYISAPDAERLLAAGAQCIGERGENPTAVGVASCTKGWGPWR